MPVPGRGHKSFIRLAREATYGTPNPTPADYKRFEIISMSINPEQGVIPDPSLNDQASRRGVFPAGIIYRGNFVVRCNYEGMEELFRGVFGLYSNNSGVGGSGGTQVVHTFKELPQLPSYTIEMFEGQPQAFTTCSQLLGAYLTSMTIRGTAGTGVDAMLQVEFGVIAKDKVQAATPIGTATTTAQVLPVLFHQATTVNVGNGDAVGLVRLRTLEVAMTSPHTDDRFYFGAANQDQPLRSDFLTVRWRFTMEYVTDTVLTAMRAGTIGSPKMVFTGAIGSTPPLARKLEIRSGLAIYTTETRPVEGYGPIIASAEMEGYNDGTGDASVLVVISSNQSIPLVP